MKLTPERLARFVSGAEGFIVKPVRGAPRRLDGRLFTAVDKQVLAGKDLVAAMTVSLIALRR